MLKWLAVALLLVVAPPRALDHRADAQAGQPAVAADRSSVVVAAAAVLRARYVFPDVGEQMAADLEAREARGAFSDALDPKAFAARLTEAMQAVGRDKHLRVVYSPAVPGQTSSPLQNPFPDFLNYGFYRVERLPGNIGYLDLRSFMYQAGVPETVAATMQWLARTDALVIDLRRNGGGQMATQTLLASYFLPPTPVQWADTLLRGRPTQSWSTLADVAGPRYLDRPVWILMSSDTFSAAESFAYHLHRLGRVPLAGETTGGGANPGVSVPLGGDFTLFVAIGQNVAPGTTTNWEGVGVTPDVAVPADDALRTAQVRLLTDLLPKTTEPRLRTERAAALADLESGRSAGRPSASGPR